MTIDEAIKDFKDDAENNRVDLDLEFAKKNEQLADWLEELKAMRNLDKTNFSDGYNRGIDDFLQKADEVISYTCSGTEFMRRLEKIADELKGGRNE